MVLIFIPGNDHLGETLGWVPCKVGSGGWWVAVSETIEHREKLLF